MFANENSNESFFSHHHANKKNYKNAPYRRFLVNQLSKLEVNTK